MNKPKKPKPPWQGIAASLAMGAEILAQPHKRAINDRQAPPPGALVWRCALPAELCKPTNKSQRTSRWARAKNQDRIYQMMLIQHGMHPRPSPLMGRPVVHVVRFTSAPVDRLSDWAKDVIDCLVVGYKKYLANGSTRERDGMGFLRDDRDTCVDARIWSEAGPKGQGFVLVSVYLGAES